jgi:serine/threonine protein kinase
VPRSLLLQVDTRYVNLRPVGRGAYGLVASADDIITGRKVSEVVPAARPDTPTRLRLRTFRTLQVAIKRVSRVFQDLVDAKRMLREIKLLRHLGHHDNCIEILDIMTGPPEVEDFHTLYIVTQLFESDLERIINSAQVSMEYLGDISSWLRILEYFRDGQRFALGNLTSPSPASSARRPPPGLPRCLPAPGLSFASIESKAHVLQ